MKYVYSLRSSETIAGMAFLVFASIFFLVIVTKLALQGHLGSALLAFIFFVGFSYLSVSVARRYLADDRYEADAEGLTVYTYGQRAYYPWTALEKVRLTPWGGGDDSNGTYFFEFKDLSNVKIPAAGRADYFVQDIKSSLNIHIEGE